MTKAEWRARAESLTRENDALRAEARSVVDITEPYTCDRDLRAGDTIPLRIPKRFLPPPTDVTTLQRIAVVLTRELPPWEFNGTEPICRDLLAAVRDVAGNPLQNELLDLITLMPDSQTQEIINYITQLREIRARHHG